jgi:surface polysaccharide O-acyltransferase-like enzyme
MSQQFTPSRTNESYHGATASTLKQTPRQRNLNIEALRILFMFLIVMFHYLIHGRGYFLAGFQNFSNSGTYVGEISLTALGELGVTGFMFISGFFGINLKWDRLVSLWIQCIFYILALSLTALLVWKDTHIGKAVAFLAPFSTGGWWFVCSYFVIYILSPIINIGIVRVNRRTFATILILLTIHLYVGAFYCHRLSTELILLLYIYLLGRYIKIHHIKILESHSGIIFLVSTVILVATSATAAYFNRAKILEILLTNYNIFVLISAVSLVLWSAKAKQVFRGKLLKIAAANTLAVYLITDYSAMRQHLIDTLKIGEGDFNLVAMICGIIIAMLCCMFIEEIRKFICRPIVNKITAFVEKRF